LNNQNVVINPVNSDFNHKCQQIRQATLKMNHIWYRLQICICIITLLYSFY